MKKNERRSFPVYLDWEKNVQKMSQEEKGFLLDMLFAKYNRRELPSIPEDYLVLSIMWDSIEFVIDRNMKQYDDKVLDSINTVPIQSAYSMRTKDKDKDKDKDKEKEKDKVKVKVNETDTDKEFNEMRKYIKN